MRIALRTGGGRGVFELAGRQGDRQASDLFGRELYYEFTPELVIPGRAVPSSSNGKPRIKLDEQKKTTHFYRLLAGVLLLPKPKREFRTTHGNVLITLEAYSMTAIKVDVSSITRDRAVVRPTDILLENADNLHEKVQFVDRMARVSALWLSAESVDSELASLLRKHKSSVFQPDPNFKNIEACCQEIIDFMETVHDPLSEIESTLGLNSEATSAEVPSMTNQTHQAEFGVDDDTSQAVARIENIRKWRQVAVRGPAAKKFRIDVRETYNDTCLFSGHRLPKTNVTSSAGVDAAHILPWSTHNINRVSNGLCLNKLCHWAFDAGVLKFFFDASINQYVLEIPNAVQTAATETNFDLEYFSSLAGPIPLSRLPANPELWPASSYLTDLNKIVFG